MATLRPSEQTTDSDDQLPYIGLEHIANGGMLTGLGVSADFVSVKTRFEAGDTLFGKLRPNLRKVLRAPFAGVSTTEILAVIARPSTDSGFLSHLLHSEPMHSHTMQGITGTKMPRTSWPHMQTYHFGLPPLPEQRAIAAVLDGVDEAIELARSQTDVLRLLKESAADALLTGRVRV